MRNVTSAVRPAATRSPPIRILLRVFLPLVLAAPSVAAQDPTKTTELYVNNAFRTVRLMTSRVVITIPGRDPTRQLTTFVNEAQELNFGFLPASMRQHQRERMELFDVDALKPDTRDDIRRITLRHPWHDVYMTSDELQQVRACCYGADCSAAVARNRYVCTNPPYVYLEDAGEGERTYKLRLFLKPTSGVGNPTLPPPVGYAFVSEHTWEMRFRGQLGIVTQALAVATKRVWRESLMMLFEKQIRLHKKRSSRFRRRPCAYPTRLRDRLIRSVSSDDFRQDIRRHLRAPEASCVPAEPTKGPYSLARYLPWREMGLRQKKDVVCCVGLVVCAQLRQTLLDLAGNSCFKGRRWSSMSQERRIAMIDRHLTVGWLRRKDEADLWLIDVVEKQLNAKATTFLFDDDA